MTSRRDEALKGVRRQLALVRALVEEVEELIPHQAGEAGLSLGTGTSTPQYQLAEELWALGERLRSASVALADVNAALSGGHDGAAPNNGAVNSPDRGR